MQKLTTEEVVRRFKEIHGDRYDYSNIVYDGVGKKVIIICKEHGEFSQYVLSHFKGQGCRKCGINRRKEYIKSNKKPPLCGIYKITSPTGKIYIGKSKNIMRRWGIHKSPYYSSGKIGNLLCNSFKDYGVLNHKFEIVEECVEHLLIIRERYWQEYYNTAEINGLNSILLSVGGFEQVYRDGLIDKYKGDRLNCRGVNNYNYGKKLPDDVVRKLSIKAYERYKNKPSLKKAISDRMKGKNHRQWGIPISEYQKNKIRERLSKLVLDTLTGVFYNSVKELSDITKINYSTLRGKLNGSYKNDTQYIQC